MEAYETQLDKLKSGEIEKIKVSLEQFMLFREVWLTREDRKYFVGEAHHNGSVTYRYDPTVL
ncbi:hypothetical protein [Enterococcus asini]|uniref:hypothetical protein n=1 Tax=Enterococcus asini TaxID=57732 RepID=UPI00266D69AF|nr:hypothetical protein [Enterococcus asini]